MAKERFEKLDKKYGSKTLRKFASKVKYETYYEEYVKLGRHMAINRIAVGVLCIAFLICAVAQFFFPEIFPLGLVILLAEFCEVFDFRTNSLRHTQIMVIICTAVDRATAADAYSSISEALVQGIELLQGTKDKTKKRVRKDKNVKE